MHAGELFIQLSTVLILGSVITGIIHFLRQPLIIGYLLTGFLVGPLALNLLDTSNVLNEISTIGIALLLFIVGLELNMQNLSRLKRVVFGTTILQVIFVSTISFLVANLLGFYGIEAFVLSIALALSSTVIIIKVFTDKKELTRLYAQITIGVLILQDLVATGVKIFLAGQKSGVVSWSDIGLLTAKAALLFAGLYLLSKFVLPKLVAIVESSKELLLIAAIGWALAIAALFEYLGFSIEVGALFAGVALAATPFNQEIAARLKPLRDFFIVIFFIALTTSITPGQLSGIWLPVLAFSIIIVLLKPFVTIVGLGMAGYTKRTSFKTAVSLSQVSEFSFILIASAVGSGLASATTQAIVLIVGIITFITSTYMMKYDDEIFNKIENRLQLFERKVTKLEQPEANAHFPIVLFGYRKGGIEFIRTFKAMNKRFIVVDYDPEAAEQLERNNIHFMYGDVTDLELISELNLNKSKMVISTISDFATNEFLAQWLRANNPDAVLICSAENAEYASELYNLGANYVMMPHFIGSEKISSFIKKSGFRRSEFNRFRDQHLKYIQTHLGEDVIQVE